jgi:hypothetical protein
MSAPITASAHTHVGTAPPGYQNEWVTHTVHWHGFPSLPVERDEYVDSPEFMLLGNQWCLAITPGGEEDAEEGMVSLYLQNMSDKAIDIDFAFSVNDENGKQVAYKYSNGSEHFDPVDVSTTGGDDDDDASSGGFTNFTKRGTLAIEVRMRLSVPRSVPTNPVPPPFIPENPSACKIIQGLFMNDKYSDIIFKVGGRNGKGNARKVAKTTPLSFPAHRCIVENCSSILAELCESHSDGTSQIQINDVSPDIFHLLLSYIYGATVSDDDMVLLLTVLYMT